MPRHARIDFPGLLQHVIVRGIERTDIFLDDDDRDNFCQRLQALLVKSATPCLAWCLLDNHVHLLLRPAEIPLAVFMRRLLTGYALSFNLRHNRTGHLFQNRYKSIVCDEDAYLLELIRYIHLNPIRAGVINHLDQLRLYPWSGHPQVMGLSEQRLINTDEVLSRFSRNATAARNIYLEFLADGLSHKDAPNLSRGGRQTSRQLDCSLSDEDLFDERILGVGNFAENVLGRQNDQQPEVSLDQLISTITDYYGIDAAKITAPTKERTAVSAKSVICYLAMRRLLCPGVEVARRLGYSTSAASHASSRGERLFEDDEKIQQTFSEMWK